MAATLEHVTGRLLSWAVLPMIGAYRAVVSPHKGFRCAHALAYGRSCSDVALGALRALPISEAMPVIQLQFAACRSAYFELGGGASLDPSLVQEVWRLMDMEGLRVAACEQPVPAP